MKQRRRWPADESYGFDNIADVLKTSPSLLIQGAAMWRSAAGRGLRYFEPARDPGRTTGGRVPFQMKTKNPAEGGILHVYWRPPHA